MNDRYDGMHASIDRAINLNFQSTTTRLINTVADAETDRQCRVRQFHFKAVRGACAENAGPDNAGRRTWCSAQNMYTQV